MSSTLLPHGVEPLLKTVELAPLLGLSPAAVRAARHRGILPAIKIGGAVRYRASDVLRALASASKAPNP
jgi:hypothetical protein